MALLGRKKKHLRNRKKSRAKQKTYAIIQCIIALFVIPLFKLSFSEMEIFFNDQNERKIATLLHVRYSARPQRLFFF